MAEKLSDLRARTQSVEELGRVTAGVRAIAALRVEQAQTALKAIRAWAELIEDAMVDGLALAGPPIVLPATSPRPDAEALVVFGAEHGFTGAFSRHLLEAADAPYPAAGRPPLFIIGERTARRAREIGRTPTWSDAMPTQVRGTGEVAGRLADALLQRIARGETSTVEVVFARNTGAGRYEVQRKRLLPLDYALFGRPTRPRPGTFLPRSCCCSAWSTSTSMQGSWRPQWRALPAKTAPDWARRSSRSRRSTTCSARCGERSSSHARSRSRRSCWSWKWERGARVGRAEPWRTASSVIRGALPSHGGMNPVTPLTVGCALNLFSGATMRKQSPSRGGPRAHLLPLATAVSLLLAACLGGSDTPASGPAAGQPQPSEPPSIGPPTSGTPAAPPSPAESPATGGTTLYSYCDPSAAIAAYPHFGGQAPEVVGHLYPSGGGRDYPIIDAHTHLATTTAEEADIQRRVGLYSVVDAAWDVNSTANLRAKYAKPYIIQFHLGEYFKGIDATKLPSVQASLDGQREAGAGGIKLSKDFGLTFNDSSGKRLRIDDPRLDALWERAAAERWPISIHVADPDSWMKSAYANSPYSKQELIQQFIRVVEAHPHTVLRGHPPAQPDRQRRGTRSARPVPAIATPTSTPTPRRARSTW